VFSLPLAITFWGTVKAVFGHLVAAAAATFLEFFILLGPLLLAAVLSHGISARLERRFIQLAGRGGYIYLLGWIGTPVHETGHLLMCWLFRHQVQEVRFFAPDDKTGTLGYVRHSFDPRSLYQQVGNLFIALGPLVLGAGVLFLLSWIISPPPTLLPGRLGEAQIGSFADIPAALLAWFVDVGRAVLGFFADLDVGDWRSWLFLYLVLAVGSHANLSLSDLTSARGGLTVLAVALFLANALLLIVADVPLAPFQAVGSVLGTLSSVLLVCTGLLVPLWLLLEAIGLVLDKAGGRR
jgi:hypothetical protein